MKQTTTFFFFIFFFFFIPPIFSLYTEQEILLEIKKELGEPALLQSWNSTAAHHCSGRWRGVKCSNGSVTSVSLSNLNISQPFPASICNLRNLSVIDFSFNFMPGPFPTSLYKCRNLQHLDISQNYFVGPLPPSINQLSSQLYYLSLSGNNFTGEIPSSSINQLSSLKSLLLDNNLFNGSFPVELANLSGLQHLWLANNPFVPARIPDQFGGMLRLVSLWLSQDNLFGEIPVSLEKLTEVTMLDLSWNQLTGKIPAGLWMLEKLEYVYLYYNKLSGGINETFGARNLVEIDVSMNRLTGPIPRGIGNLRNLTVLLLYKNRLSGEIPDSIGLLPSLRDIRIFENNLTGVLPPELGKHSRLWNLEVPNNALSGELPRFLCAGGNLSSLVVFNNNFTGNLPETLGRCPTINTIMVQNNNFYGEIPAGLLSNAVLTTVIMHHNWFSGSWPAKLPWNLTRVEIEHNRFSGDVPTSAQNLAVFKASNNLFSGALPANLATISKLQVLSLGGNQITGEIPGSIASLRQLTELNLSSNRLSGGIPAAIGSMPVLTSLDLSNNKLTGAVPAEMGDLSFTFLNLSSNHLSGEIPARLQNQAYDESFLSNPDLCSSNSLLNLRICAHQKGSGEDSNRILVVLVVLGVIFFIGSVVLVFLVLRERRRKRQRQRDVLAKWKLVSFHIGEFSESNILRGLTQENLIGSGGAGEVYRIACGSHAGETVAVKKIWNSRNLDMKLEKQFEAEVEILGSIRHANIVKLLCCISSSDSKLLVYEYMDNGSLDHWLHPSRQPGSGLGQYSSTLDWPARLKVAVGAAKGLCYMHHDTTPIVHRDVKSSNILLDSELNAKIADFGLARILLKAEEPESVSSVAGSFGYIAPEYGRLRKVNEKVDVYSFGVVLLELTTGREANNGEMCLADWVLKHFREGGSFVDAIDEGIRDPSHIEEIEVVLRLGMICTGDLPAKRPSMKEVLDILQRCNGKIENGWVKPSLEYDAAPLLRSKWGSYRKRISLDEKDNSKVDSCV